MATVDKTGSQVRRGYPGSDRDLIYVKQCEVDTGGDNASSSDIYQMLDVDKVAVLFVFLEVLTVEGGTLTVDVGDGDDADGFLDGVDCNGSNGDMYSSLSAYAANTTNADMDMTTPTQLYGLRGGKFYGSADTIDITFNNAADTAKLLLSACIVDPHPGT